MASLQESTRSPQLPIPRGSPSGSITKSPSQFSTACLIGPSSSPSPNRKRACPNYLKIDDAVPPNKKLNTPNKEEKEILYKRLAEEKRTPFYLAPFPILPLGNKFSSISPGIYSFLQQQQQQQQLATAPQQAFPSSLTLSPSTSIVGSYMANSPGSSSSLVGNTAGISGLPTPGGSSIGTPPRPMYSSYPTPLLKFPFSPPTPLLSPWNYSNRSMSVSSSVATPGPPSNESLTGDPTGMLQCLNRNSASNEGSIALATSTPRNDTESVADSSSQKHQGTLTTTTTTITIATSTTATTTSTPGLGLMSGITPGSWVITSAPGSSPSIQSKPHLKSSHHTGLGSVQSPLSAGQAPYSYPGSVSSCPSVSSSSGCSSSSENQDLAAISNNFILSEYHVGPHRLISGKEIDNQTEEPTTSGRNTPVDPTSADNDRSCVLPSEVACKLLSSTGQCYPPPGFSSEPPNNLPLPRPSNKGALHSSKSSHSVKPNSPHPFSVESMSSGSPQGYLGACHNIVDRPSSGVSSMSSSLSSRDSTPDPDEIKHDPNKAPQGVDTFCLVPGRLSLLSSTQKYKVTVDEVRRRLSHPECLNASVLGGILRRAKSKNGGTVLRQRLQEIGVMLPSGRRKQTDLSLLTSLVENESLHLAGDFHRLCENFFPHAELGQIIARQHVATPEAQHRVSMVKATQVIVSELQAMLDAVGGPSNLRPNDPNNPYPGLTNFSLLTHGFGNPAINTGLGVLQTYLQELLAYYEGKKPILPDNRYSMLNENGSQSATSLASPHAEMKAESAPMHSQPTSHHQHQHHHPLQMYTTRHYPQSEYQEIVTSTDPEAGTVEVTLKEEPVESPSTFT